MSPQDFFDLVLPREGLRVAGALVPVQGEPKPVMRHKFLTNNAQLAITAQHFDGRDLPTYFACATYKAAQGRTQDNVAFVRALWLDLDCGPGKGFPNKSAAAAALQEFITAAGLPVPTIVNSGGGLHVYWALTADLTREEWQPLADMLKASCKAHGLAADHVRTADAASVLRPPGTTNRKREKPAAVEVKYVGAATDLLTIRTALRSFLETHVGATPTDTLDELGPRPAHLTAFTANDDLVTSAEYPPAFADRIADQCAVMGAIRESKGNVDQPTWYHGLQVLAKCEDGPTVAHEWSKGHPAYSRAETQATFDRVSAYKPATCAKLSDCMPTVCAACPHWGKINSPISLGFAPPVITASRIASAFGSAPEEPEEITLPFGFAWARVDAPYPQLCRTVREGDLLVNHPFCDVLFYPISRVLHQNDGSLHAYEAIVREDEVREFMIPGSVGGSGGAKLYELLGSQEVVALNGQKHHLDAYVSTWFRELKNRKAIVPSCSHFGWQPNGSFLVGRDLYCGDGTTERPLVIGTAAATAGDLDCVGDYDQWKADVNTAYNHPDQEALQFCIMSAMAAPLIHMFKDLSGLTVYAYSEGSGKGKTTAQRVGLSAFGNWDRLQRLGGQITENALLEFMGRCHNLPVVLDELTNKEGKFASDLVFEVASGRGKERLRQNGTPSGNNYNWATLLLASGNMRLSEKLGMVRGNASAEIYRLFEFQVDSPPTLDSSAAAELFPRFLDNYGHAGRELVRHIAANYDAVRQQLLDEKRAFDQLIRVKQSERFWSALCASVLTTTKLCNSLDIVQFDVLELQQWLVRQVSANRGGLAENVGDPTDVFSRMLQELWQGVLVTEGEGNLAAGNPAALVSSMAPRGEITGRAIIAVTATEKNTLAITSSAAKKWCNKNGVSPKTLLASASAAGYAEDKPRVVNLAKGIKNYAMTLPGQVQCWIINPEKMGLDLSAAGNDKN